MDRRLGKRSGISPATAWRASANFMSGFSNFLLLPRSISKGGMVLLAVVALAGCGPENLDKRNSAPEGAHVEQEPQREALTPPIAVSPADRAEILAAVAAAADATAAGQKSPQANLALTDRMFVLRLPFGCRGLPEPDGAKVRFDARSGVLRIAITPQQWKSDSRIGGLAQGKPFEAIEGFWIERPWTASEVCPKVAMAPLPSVGEQSPASAAPAVPPTTAIAQFMEPGSPRTSQRRNRPYSYTGKPTLSEADLQTGFALKLAGRIAGFADGQPVHCDGTEPSHPPICAISVELTSVAIEIAPSGDVLSEWKF